jgi:hypothetical protein
MVFIWKNPNLEACENFREALKSIVTNLFPTISSTGIGWECNKNVFNDNPARRIYLSTVLPVKRIFTEFPFIISKIQNGKTVKNYFL